jgi:hypothetical protein
VSTYVGLVISHRLATVNELETVYSMEDVYLFMEILAVDRYNARPE